MSEQMITYAHDNDDSAMAPANPSAIANAAPPVIKTERLTRRIRGVYAIRNVSMTIRPGEVYGLIGVQGAGKSTLAQILLGLMHADSGTIRLFGGESTNRARARIGYLPERPRYHGNFSGRDYLRFQAELSGLKSKEAQLVAARLADTVELGDAARKLIGGYSKSLRQRFGLAVALIAGGSTPPDLLVLDEPATGFDDETAATFRDVVLDCKAQGSTVLICSRELTQVERTCTNIGILRAGRLLVQTPIDDSPRAHIVAVAREGAADIMPHLVDYLGRLHPSVLVRGGAQEGEHMHLVLPTGPGVPHAIAMKAAALRAMVDARWDIVSVYTENRDLESLFLQALPSSDTAKTTKTATSTPTPAESQQTTIEAKSSTPKSPDTGPLSEESPSADDTVTGQTPALEAIPTEAATTTSAATGPLPALESQIEPSVSRSPITGPLGTTGLDVANVQSGNGVEHTVQASSSGPSTAPLPPLSPGLTTDDFATLLSPLPVRAVSSARRGQVVAEALAEPVSVSNEGSDNGDNRE